MAGCGAGRIVRRPRHGALPACGSTSVRRLTGLRVPVEGGDWADAGNGHRRGSPGYGRSCLRRAAPRQSYVANNTTDVFDDMNPDDPWKRAAADREAASLEKEGHALLGPVTGAEAEFGRHEGTPGAIARGRRGGPRTGPRPRHRRDVLRPADRHGTDWIPSVIADAVRHYPILVPVNGRRPEQSDFLKDAARTETWRGLRVGVLHSASPIGNPPVGRDAGNAARSDTLKPDNCNTKSDLHAISAETSA